MSENGDVLLTAIREQIAAAYDHGYLDGRRDGALNQSYAERLREKSAPARAGVVQAATLALAETVETLHEDDAAMGHV